MASRGDVGLAELVSSINATLAASSRFWSQLLMGEPCCRRHSGSAGLRAPGEVLAGHWVLSGKTRHPGGVAARRNAPLQGDC